MPVTAPGMAVDIRMWQFEATIVSLDDPNDLFGDVRLGDTVRGDFAYDVSSDATTFGEGWEDYDHAIDFHGIRLSIENPRTGGELRYEDDPEFGYLTSVFTDDSYIEESGVLFWQDVIPPRPNLFGLIFMQFLGPQVLSNTELPTELALEDWTVAAIYLGSDDNLTNAIIAQIFSLTPILPGDYDGDGDADGGDLLSWQRGESRTALSAFDLTTWQSKFGEVMAVAGEPVQGVPEPTAGVIAAVGAVLAVGLRDRIRCRDA